MNSADRRAGVDSIKSAIPSKTNGHSMRSWTSPRRFITSLVPEVDGNRVGIVGISWGGYLTCLAADLDPRFKFAISVYGCGFLGEDSAWLPQFAKMGRRDTAGLRV